KEWRSGIPTEQAREKLGTFPSFPARRVCCKPVAVWTIHPASANKIPPPGRKLRRRHKPPGKPSSPATRSHFTSSTEPSGRQPPAVVPRLCPFRARPRFVSGQPRHPIDELCRRKRLALLTLGKFVYRLPITPPAQSAIGGREEMGCIARAHR